MNLHPSLIDTETWVSLALHPPSLVDFCRGQVEQLIAVFPLRAAWIVYETARSAKKQVVAIPVETDLDEHGDGIFYLVSEAWRQRPSYYHSMALNLAEDSVAYIYPLGEPDNSSEYLLLWAWQRLLPHQQQLALQQSCLMRQILALSRRNQQLEAKVTAQEQALGRLGHQLGNPLALIQLYAEILNLQLAEGPQQEQATLICDTVVRLKKQLSQLMQYGRDCRLHIEPHSLQEILADSLQEITPWLEQSQLQLSLLTSHVTLPVDRGQLKQVFDNLLSNAISFSPPKSTITCQWHIFAHEVLVQISDQGPGISEEDLQHLFQPYYSRREGGQGLGLAIAQKVIFDHQGRLWVENLPAGGAQFSFTLPRHRSRSL